MSLRLAVATAWLTLLSAPPAAAVSVGQIDDFQGGTTEAWRIGVGGALPANVAGGGPAGAADSYLRFDSNGGRVAGRHVFFNSDQWSGDYSAAGVTAIRFDAINLSASETLFVRVAIGDAERGQSGTWFASTNPVTLTPGSGWQTVRLPIAEPDMTLDRGGAPFADVVSSVVSLRILSAETVSRRGDQIVASIGVDNITAVPEPSATATLAAAAGVFAARRRRDECRRG
ncbi:MAG: PEP-CTERM sorting domain-containing protein [Planctomycetota bacterium]